MNVQIERGTDVNCALFTALADIQNHETSLAGALICLRERFHSAHPLYWFYQGSNHIAIQSHNHKQRVAIIKE